jgi:hypothetical protein
MKAKTFLSYIILSSTLILLSACGQKKTEWKGTIEEVDGVTVAKNPKEPMYGEEIFTLEEELSIGESEGQDEYILSIINSVAVDDLENIYVLDMQLKKVRVFDSKGQYVRTIGEGGGQGPGEVRVPAQIQITSQNEAKIFDMPARSLNFFSLDGNFLRRIPLIKMPFPAKSFIDSNGDLIGYFMYVEEDEPITALLKYNSKQERQFKMAQLDPLSEKERNKRPLQPSLLFDISDGDNIVWANSLKYEINFVSAEGILLKKISKEHVPIEIKEQDKKEIVPAIFGKESVSPEEEANFVKYFDPINWISVDEENRIFIDTLEKTKDRKYYYHDVFDSEGRYIAKVGLPSWPTLSMVWKNNKLYTIEENEEGFMIVKRYKVTWKI